MGKRPTTHSLRYFNSGSV